jgi:hypothetical protein
VNRSALRDSADAAIKALSAGLTLDDTRRVFILGPYQPETSLTLLVRIRDTLRTKFHYAAYLENEFSLGVSLQETSRQLFDLSQLGLFIVTNEGLDRGWQFELADLAGLSGTPLAKIAYYYESFDKLQGPVRDFLVNHSLRQGALVRLGSMDRTVGGIAQAVNTYFLDLA